MKDVFTARQVFVLGLFFALQLDLAAANDGVVRFDAPAMIAVRPIASDRPSESESSLEKIIELLLLSVFVMFFCRIALSYTPPIISNVHHIFRT